MPGIIERPAKLITISHKDTIKAAAAKMFSNKVSCLIVNNDDDDFIGLVTERDIVTRIAAASIDIERTTIAGIMTTQIISCSPNTPSNKVREIMTSNQIRHLPIVDNGAVVGIVSTRDLMARQLLEDRAAAEEVATLSNCLKSIDLNEVADIVTREVPKLFGADKCVLFIRHPRTSTLTASQKQGTSNIEPHLVSCNNCSCPKETLSAIFDSRYPILDDDSASSTKYLLSNIPLPCEMLGAKSPRLVIPLNLDYQDGSAKGVWAARTGKESVPDCYLCMCGLSASVATNRELTSYKAKLARDILNSHLTNAKLYLQARLTSLTDALTGVGSRKRLEDKLQAECARAKRYKRLFSVAIIDLDNFKTINDVLGHATGDDALIKLAESMKSQIRTTDVLTRYGGDEFVIIMPETKTKEAVKLLERIKDKVQQINLVEKLSMTISCGVSQSLFDRSRLGHAASGDTDSSRNIMRRADLALYEAKSAGRNCVKVWDKTMSKALSDKDIETEKIKMLQRRIAGLSEQAEKVFIQSIWGLVQALEAKDSYTKKHSENVMYYAVAIAEAMKIDHKQIDVICRAAMIHDIGKIGIPDSILSIPGKLTPRQRSIIEQHPLIAVRILGKMTFLEQEVAIVRHHHEKWNGQGYPDGISNTSIPIGARIIAVADTFDAITSNRSYHNARPLDEAIVIIVDSSGYDFDPEVVKALVSWVEKIRSQLGKSQLTPEDLLDSQKQCDNSTMAELVADAL